MVNSSLTSRRVATAVGLIIAVSFSGCSTPATSVTQASGSSQGASSDIQIPVDGTVDVYARRVEAFETNPAGRSSHASRILYADALLHLNEPRKAIPGLIDTELVFPESYLNSLYLGLAYEMAGDLKSARYWVSKTIERNAEARSGSEWLHLAMIEARLALANDPEWLKNHSVLNNNTHRLTDDILSAIRIQLAVRGDFGMKDDLVVSDLYFEAGICATSLSARREYFAQALEISALRMGDIERHERVRARAHASAQVH